MRKALRAEAGKEEAIRKCGLKKTTKRKTRPALKGSEDLRDHVWVPQPTAGAWSSAARWGSPRVQNPLTAVRMWNELSPPTGHSSK